MSGEPVPTLADYGWSRDFPTRFSDDDLLGHLHNGVYHQAMDTTVLAWLQGAGHLSSASPVAPLVVTSTCRFLASGAFPDVLRVGLRADAVGRTSMTWGMGVFRERDGALLALGAVVHVAVDVATRRPVPVPEDLRARVTAELSVLPTA